MRAAARDAWLSALRSGHYQQGALKLRTIADGFCCLGVLTDLAVKAGAGRWETTMTSTCHIFVPTGKTLDDVKVGTNTASLPEEVVAWAGLPPLIDVLGSGFGGLGTPLSGLNDRGASFKEIADIIEHHTTGV